VRKGLIELKEGVVVRVGAAGAGARARLGAGVRHVVAYSGDMPGNPDDPDRHEAAQLGEEGESEAY
jgi:hypothetical protein